MRRLHSAPAAAPRAAGDNSLNTAAAGSRVDVMNNFFNEMNSEESGEFTNFCRMSRTDVEFMLNKIESMIKKQTRLRIYYYYETKIPEKETEWKEMAEEFETKWNFSHCVGSCDGKHIAIEKPPESGSLFYNYKGFFSIVLFAVVNANYEFIHKYGMSRYKSRTLKSTSFSFEHAMVHAATANKRIRPSLLCGCRALTERSNRAKSYYTTRYSASKRVSTAEPIRSV
ncbi:unnamed protein product [Arctia plantaginis]|uniref:Uncharacterized protein n=1 Tax=Arctia plantaginis TaxID=874455 RepID=A0A8S0ZNE9_ARCPL|nr:unnamed protein product [Arctia plantaginis]